MKHCNCWFKQYFFIQAVSLSIPATVSTDQHMTMNWFELESTKINLISSLSFAIASMCLTISTFYTVPQLFKNKITMLDTRKEVQVHVYHLTIKFQHLLYLLYLAVSIQASCKSNFLATTAIWLIYTLKYELPFLTHVQKEQDKQTYFRKAAISHCYAHNQTSIFCQ